MHLTEQTSDALDHRMMLAHDFALINALQVDAADRADLDGLPLVPKRHRDKAHLFPVLVDLRALSDARRIDLIDRVQHWRAACGAPYFSALVTCPERADLLARHLVRRSDVRLPEGGQDVLRLHDPHMFRHLRWIFDAQQQSLLLGPILRWTWPEPDGAWHSLAHDPGRPHPRAGRLCIGAQQWTTLRRLPDIHNVLAALRRAAPQLDDGPELARRVNRHLAEAEHAFKRPAAADRALYAEHAVRFGEALYRHPDACHRMTRVHAGHQGYFSAFACIDDDELQAMATAAQEPAREST